MALDIGVSVTDNRRQLHRLGVAYLLDLARGVTEHIDRDLVTALVFLGILRANIGVLTAKPNLAEPYSSFADIPPDSLRLPVTVYAVSRDLGLPYETVRRHVNKLKDSGRCDSVKDGLIIPARAMAEPGLMALVSVAMRITTAFVADSARAGFVARTEAQLNAPDSSRQVSRLAIDYFLDGLKLLGRGGGLDVLSVLVVRAVTTENVRALTDDPELTRVYGAIEAVPPDDLRQPVSVYALAKFLMLPYETARRITLKLAKRGFLERVGPQGLIVPAALIRRPGSVRNAMAHAEMTAAFLERLAEVGVRAPPPAPGD